MSARILRSPSSFADALRAGAPAGVGAAAGRRRGGRAALIAVLAALAACDGREAPPLPTTTPCTTNDDCPAGAQCVPLAEGEALCIAVHAIPLVVRASPAALAAPGGTVELTWTTGPAFGPCTLAAGDAPPVRAISPALRTVKAPTTFALRCERPGAAPAEASVHVGLLEIARFTTSTPLVDSTAPARLAWSATDGALCTLEARPYGPCGAVTTPAARSERGPAGVDVDADEDAAFGAVDDAANPADPGEPDDGERGTADGGDACAARQSGELPAVVDDHATDPVLESTRFVLRCTLAGVALRSAPVDVHVRPTTSGALTGRLHRGAAAVELQWSVANAARCFAMRDPGPLRTAPPLRAVVPGAPLEVDGRVTLSVRCEGTDGTPVDVAGTLVAFGGNVGPAAAAELAGVELLTGHLLAQRARGPVRFEGDALVEVGGSILIEDTVGRVALDLPRLTRIGSRLSLARNADLHLAPGTFRALTAVHDLSFTQNALTFSTTGFRPGAQVEVTSNAASGQLELDALREVTFIRVVGNGLLARLSLPALQAVSELAVVDNPRLGALRLPQLQDVAIGIEIRGNDCLHLLEAPRVPPGARGASAMQRTARAGECAGL